MNTMLILLFVIVGSILADVSINKSYLFINSTQFPLAVNILAFIAVAVICVVGQYFIFKFVGKSIKEVRPVRKLHFSVIYKIVRLIQCALIAILLLVILQMVISSHYDSRLLISTILISYTSAIFILGIIARRFFYWFLTNRNSVTLLYGLATAVIAINATIGLVLSFLLIIHHNKR